MMNALKFGISISSLTAVCLAQDGLTIDNKHKERVSAPEVESIYSSAGSVVQREFDLGHPLYSQVRLVLGAGKNEIWFPDEKSGLPVGAVRVRTGSGVAGFCGSDAIAAEVDHSKVGGGLGRFKFGN